MKTSIVTPFTILHRLEILFQISNYSSSLFHTFYISVKVECTPSDMMVTLSFGQVCSISSQFFAFLISRMSLIIDFLKVFGFKSIIQDFGHLGYYSDTLLEISDEYRAAFSPANINLTDTGGDSFCDFKFISSQEFNGRVYATGNPQACFELGTGQTEISLRIPIGTQCGSVQSVGRESGPDLSLTFIFSRAEEDMSTTWSSRPIRSSCR